MQVHIYRDDIAPRDYRWCATDREYDLDVPVGSGATPLKAIEDLLWHLVSVRKECESFESVTGPGLSGSTHV